ncbi:ammonium transporter [Holotrichia oblita]|uniref:Ammonium transporter n=1 Tax=Holotrichia oblita TaxID=644536 RepID=A0ACB9TFA4_HOLOL|nr:ammonium transporter [Holotrichia oblita]
MDGSNIIFGFGITILGAAIITTMLAGRLHFVGYVLIAFIYSGISQPIMMHWIWHPKGWMNNNNLFHVPLKIYDHGGALAVHISAGLVGFIGIIFLGRRLLKLKDIDESSLAAESPNSIILGYFLVANGLIGLSLPYSIADRSHNNDYVSVILINSVLSLSGGISASVLLEFILWRQVFNYWVLLRLFQGGIAGLVLTSSFINYCKPPVSFAITFVAGILVSCMSKLLYKTALEDYCNIIPIHLFCGVWSPILQPFFADMSIFSFLWQISCTLIILSSIFMLFTLIFLMLYCNGFLRNQYEANSHLRSLNVLKRSTECPLSRLFVLNDKDAILETGSIGKCPSNLAFGNEIKSSSKLKIQNNIKTRKDSNSSKLNHYIKKQETDIVGREPHLSLKPKNIYTIRKTATNESKNSMSKEKRLCSGDVLSDNDVFKLEDLIAQSNGALTKSNTKKCSAKTKIRRAKSHIKLSKSKRYVDFTKRKLLKRNCKNKNNEYINVCINRSLELIAYDKKYNDGIMSFKVPRVLEYISD